MVVFLSPVCYTDGKEVRGGISMTLQQAIASLDIPMPDKLLSAIPADLSEKNAEQFSPAMFKKLQSAVENYAKGIAFNARLYAARELNECCDAFFNDAFSKVCRLERVFDRTELDVLLLKELQGGSDDSLYNQSQADRGVQFGMSTNAVQARIHSLEDGKEILGHYVKIGIAGRARTAYDNTIHPVFLALNLKEAYFLTVELRKAYAGTPYEELVTSLANDIYSQLSDYAKRKLQPHLESANLEYHPIEPGALIEPRMETYDAIFFLKSEIPCRLILEDGSSYVGTVQLGSSGFVLETADGTFVTLPADQAKYRLTVVDH